MTRPELKEIILDWCVDPWNCTSEDFQPLTSLHEAKQWMIEIWHDQDLAEIEENERLPRDTTPAAFMEMWNEICEDYFATHPVDDDEEDEEETPARPVPLRIVPVTVCGEESWLVYNAVSDCVKSLFPCEWFTKDEAVAKYCDMHEIDPDNVITEVKQ